MNRARRLVIAAAVAILAVATGGIAAFAGTDSTRLSGQQRRVIHEATEQYRHLDVALADGYVPVGECVEVPDTGGMGYHYLHPQLASDDVIDPVRPELLVYHEDRKGRLRLGAVEYFVADADQNLETDDDRPSLFGEYSFDGPMAGHEPDMPIHYDLHVWLYRSNPAGQLEAWNPKVSCP